VALRVLLLACLLPLAILCAQTAQLDGNQALFTVLAALNASSANGGPDADSPSNHPLRRAVIEEVLRRKPASLASLRDFFRQYRQDSPAVELRLWASWALLVGDAPEFAFKLKDHQLPPDVLGLKDLASLLGSFYKEAGIAGMWKQSQPAYEQFQARYHEPASQAVTAVSAYVRAPLSGTFGGRRFQVVTDLLGAPNQILFLPFFDEYFLVVTHSAEPHTNDVRQAYLHYLIDPMFTNQMAKVDEKKALADYAINSPLPDFYKKDFLLLATKSMVKAVETRLERGASRKQAMLDQAMKEGYILAAHFAEQLPVYEKQEQSMKLYFPELIASINLAREEKRLEGFEFAVKRTERRAKPVEAPPPPEPSAIEKSLTEAEALYTGRDLGKAREAFAAILTSTDQREAHARAYYGLGRIATLNRDPESAERLFTKALETGAPPHEKAWTLVYLGRLAQAARQEEQAAGRYRAALAVEGGSAKAKEAAVQALKAMPEKAK